MNTPPSARKRDMLKGLLTKSSSPSPPGHAVAPLPPPPPPNWSPSPAPNSRPHAQQSAPLARAPHLAVASSRNYTRPGTTVPSRTPTSFIHQDSAATRSGAPLAVDPGQKFLSDALNRLTNENRSIVERYSAAGIDISKALSACYNAAVEKKTICDNTDWRWRFGSRTVELKDEATKIVRGLEKFKSVGDIAVSADPIHAGLPWAGVRILLEVATSKQQLMESLITGMSLTMFMSGRLEIYFEFLRKLPSTRSKAQLEVALLAMYVQLLTFISRAIQIYEKSSAARTMAALWEKADLADFQSDCDRLAIRVAEDARNCSVEQNSSAIAELQKALAALDQMELVQESIDRLHNKIDLKALEIVPGASHNSYDSTTSPCLPGTRVDLLNQIIRWADDPNGKKIFWLCGMAGTGKSTVSHSIASHFDKQNHRIWGTEYRRLALSFFFKREGDRGSPRKFFSTFARLLADVIPGIGHHMAAALKIDADLCNKSLNEQCEKLLVVPLNKMTKDQLPRSTIVLVIDALDECNKEEDLTTVLKLLAQIFDRSLPQLRLFITSRPELDPEAAFRAIPSTLYHNIRLETLQVDVINHDIRAFLEYGFAEIKNKRLNGLYPEVLPADWPSTRDIAKLVDLASPLFQFASTVLRYVQGTEHTDPISRLKVILGSQHDARLSGLDRLYEPILRSLFLSYGDDETAAITQFQEIVGSIVVLSDSLSMNALSQLLEIGVHSVQSCVGRLRSVLDIPHSPDQPIRLVHLSFHDYLIQPKEGNNNKFWVDAKKTHARLAQQCLKLLSQRSTLRYDICNVRHPGTKRADVKKDLIAKHIPAHLAYASRYWLWHLTESGQKLDDDSLAYQFLRTNFLYWFETMSWLDSLSSAISQLLSVQSVVSSRGSDLLAFLTDAQRFLHRNRHVVDLAPLQLYSSALIFSPTQSLIRRTFEGQHHQRWPCRVPQVPRNWSSEIQRFELSFETLKEYSYFQDKDINNGTIVILSRTGELCIYSTSSGVQIRKLERPNFKRHDFMDTFYSNSSDAFSYDGQLLAESRPDHTVLISRLHFDRTEELWTLKGHRKKISAISFSPSKRYLATGSWDDTVRLWDMKTGTQLHKFEVFSTNQLTFSNGLHTDYLACQAMNKCRVWDLATYKVVQDFKLGQGQGIPFAFASNGQFLARNSSENSDDKTVRLWDIMTGIAIKRFDGDLSGVRNGAFPLVSTKRLAATCCSGIYIQIWDLATGREIQRFDFSGDDIETFKFSPDGHMLAVGTYKRNLRLFDTSIKEREETPGGFGGRVHEIEFSSTGRLFATMHPRGPQLWDSTTGQRLPGWQPGATVRSSNVGLPGAVKYSSCKGMLFSPDEKTFAVSADTWLDLWDVKSGELIRTITLQSPKGHMIFSADSSRVFIQSIGSWSHRVRDGNGGNSNGSDRWKPDPNSLSTTPPPPLLAAIARGEWDPWVRFQNEDFLWLPQEYRPTAFAAHGSKLVTGHASGAVHIYDCSNLVRRITQPMNS